MPCEELRITVGAAVHSCLQMFFYNLLRFLAQLLNMANHAFFVQGQGYLIKMFF